MREMFGFCFDLDFISGKLLGPKDHFYQQELDNFQARGKPRFSVYEFFIPFQRIISLRASFSIV